MLPSCRPSFFFNAPATTEIYTLSLHDALPISSRDGARAPGRDPRRRDRLHDLALDHPRRSEEHTSELQSHSDLVCRLLLEKKKKKEVGTGPLGKTAEGTMKKLATDVGEREGHS